MRPCVYVRLCVQLLRQYVEKTKQTITPLKQRRAKDRTRKKEGHHDNISQSNSTVQEKQSSVVKDNRTKNKNKKQTGVLKFGLSPYK